MYAQYDAVAIDVSKYCGLYFVQNCEGVITLAGVGAVRVKAVLIFLTRRRIFGTLVYIWEKREIDWFPKYELVLILKLGKLGNLPEKIHINNMRMSSLKTYRTYYSVSYNCMYLVTHLCSCKLPSLSVWAWRYCSDTRSPIWVFLLFWR